MWAGLALTNHGVKNIVIQIDFSCSFCCFQAVLQRVMHYNLISLKMTRIRLIVILCVLLISSEGNTEIFFCSFPYASRIPSFKGSCNSKQYALPSKLNLPFFLVVIEYLLLKSCDIEINSGPLLPYALMMKELELCNSRIKILHQNARSLAGEHLLLKELIQDIGYNCVYAFSETWLS